MKVAIAHSDASTTVAIRTELRNHPDIDVLWSTPDGLEALRLCGLDRPEVLLMGLDLASMGGTEATSSIVTSSPCAIIIVTEDAARDAGRVFAAMSVGALDVAIVRPLERNRREDFLVPLVRKIHYAARLNPNPVAASRSRVSSAASPALLAIGASAGGPAAVAQVLGALPSGLPLAIAVVQHVDAEFVASMATWLDGQTDLMVRLADAGEQPEPGRVYIAGGNNHLVVQRDGSFAHLSEPRDVLYRPSADMLLESVARHWQGAAIGLILSGMGRDGAKGLRKMRDAGARTIAQDQSTSAVYGMPRAAVELEAATDVLPLAEIAPFVCNLLRGESAFHKQKR